MSTQIFKKKVPSHKLFNLLEAICLKNEKYYTLNFEAFKKGLFNDLILVFIEDCKEYYHVSKHKYLIKKQTFNSFTTILRQICNFNKIQYVSKIQYDKSMYNIIYYVYHNKSTE